MWAFGWVLWQLINYRHITKCMVITPWDKLLSSSCSWLQQQCYTKQQLNRWKYWAVDTYLLIPCSSVQYTFPLSTASSITSQYPSLTSDCPELPLLPHDYLLCLSRSCHALSFLKYFIRAVAIFWHPLTYTLRLHRHLSTKIFVGGLSTETREKEFRDYFQQFGTVKDAG